MKILHKKYFSLQIKIIIIFFLFVICPFIAIYSWQNIYISKFIKHQITDSAIISLKHYNDSMEIKLNNLYSMVIKTSYSKDTSNFINTYNTNKNSSDMYLGIKNFKNDLFVSSSILNIDIISLVITNTDSVLYQYNNNIFKDRLKISETFWFNKTLNNKGKISFNGINKHNILLKNNTSSYLTYDISQTLYDSDSKNVIGTVYLAVDFNKLFKSELLKNKTILYQNQSSPATLYSPTNILINTVDKGKIKMLLNQKEGFFDIEINEKKYICVFSGFNNYGWRTIELTPYELLLNKASQIKNIGILVSVICLIFFSIFILNIISKLIMPLQLLIKHVKNEDFSSVLNKNSYLEIKHINNDIISIIKNSKEIEKDLTFANINVVKNETKKLQLQMNPHFLYNTLSSISILAQSNRLEDVSNVSINLSKLLYACMDKDGEFVLVSQEIATLESYLKIQKIIYEDSIVFKTKFNSDFNNYKIPNFILQPIVENSILHGLDYSKTDPTISIFNYTDNNFLYFVVEDNGIGLSETTYNKIQSMLSLSNYGENKHIGILSVHKRIRLYYGDSYGLCLEKTVFGCKFVFKLPKINITQTTK